MGAVGCPVCGSARVAVGLKGWEECSACGARWVHREAGEGMVLLLPSKERLAAVAGRFSR
jgi:uncharacterized protein (DUF983 family)